MQQVNTLEKLLDVVTLNPGMASEIKQDPRKVADMLGVELTNEQVRMIAKTLDLDSVLQTAESANTMAMKVAQGIELKA